MHEITTESLLSLKEACARLPGRPHISTIWRWIQRGVNGVRLETVKIGGKRFTSTEAIERFISSTTAIANRSFEAGRASQGSKRRKEIQKAQRYLDEIGVSE